MAAKKGNPQYRAGRRHEYAVMKKYQKEGFTVIRSAGSHSVFDLIAINAEYREGLGQKQIYLIQCKTGRSKKREIRKLQESRELEKFDGVYFVNVRYE